jgi:oligopeptidase B
MFFMVHAQPITSKFPKEFNEHGNKRVDNYYWLNTPDSFTISHLQIENAYLEAYMKPTGALQDKLYKEIVGRMEQKMESLPVKSNGYWYYSRFENGAQYPKYFRRKNNMQAKEELILDVPDLAKDHNIFLVWNRRVSPDNRYMAYAVDTTGSRRGTLFIKDLHTGKLLKEVVYPMSGSLAWSSDSKILFYTIADKTVRSYKVMQHIIGTDQKTDKEIYTENDVTFSIGLSASQDNRYIFIISNSTDVSEARFIDATQPGKAPVLIQERQKGLKYFPSYYGGNVFYLYTNKDAINFKVVNTPVADPSLKNWKDIVPHKADEFIDEYYVLKNHLVVQSKKGGLPKITITNRNNNQTHDLVFSEEAFITEMSMATDEWSSDSIRFYYASLTTPGSEFSYNLNSKQKKLLKQQKVEGGFDASAYQTKRIWSKATDGTNIPVTLVYRKDNFKKDGSNPLMLFAYGSYGASSNPYFNSAIFSLLDRGFVYGIAHIRGGQELGREWYEAGRQLKKKNTFTDFIDVAQHLVNEKYTASDKLFANGGSAGGMLMGAITNMRPDLFRGIIAEVPWMDVISDMFDPNIPLVTLEYDEWGNPNDKEFYQYMLSWSPLDNVKPAQYPSILATGGLHDTQVPYFSPAKWVAKVREFNLGKNPVLLKTNMEAGHGGASGRFERQKLTALKFAFALHEMGWDEEKKQFRYKGF